jgi:hypothetical protein
MLRCSRKESLVRELKALRASDPEFPRKFEEVTQTLREHITSGHPQSKHHPIGKPCTWG